MIYNIAIDGPAGAGKSTIARRVARELSFIYVDTGAMYRAMALYLLRRKVNRDDTEQIGNICQDAEISIEYQNGEQQVILNGENVTGLLRTEETGNMASRTSKYKEGKFIPAYRRSRKYGICKFCSSACTRKTAQFAAQTCKRYECCYGWPRHWYNDSSGCRCKDLSDRKFPYPCQETLSRTSGKRNCL